jgi:ATP-binding cassette subfamily F protein uup
MGTLVSAHQLKKAFGARPLFDGLTFSIESGERVGLIGPNGAGKSTLLRILASQASVDEGTLAFQRGLRVGFLEQVPAFAEGATVLSTILEGTENPEDWEAIALAQELMSKLALNGFSGHHISEQTPVARLSGGWKKRVALARELARRPDLLLLDEPTNHLDVESILWLEEMLARASFAALTITHDRLFLQRVANRIIELDPRNPGGLLSISGDYSAFVEAKEQLLAAQERREVVLKNTLRRETEWLRRGAKARTTKQQARIQRHGQLSEEVDDLSQRNQSRTVRLDFQSAEKSPKKLIEAKGISKAFGDKKIFSNLDLILSPGVRLGILGPNGCGKSTLIRTLLGLDQSDSGEVLRSENLAVAYFDQTRDTLDPELTVLKTLCPVGDFVSFRGNRIHIRSYLDRFLFSRDQAEMTVGKLSGGEQSRLLLARLMLTDANLLILDEPTNDLDLATLNVLEEVLTEFGGAVLLVTHDRYFLDQVATKILAFEPESQTGKLLPFADLFQWESWHVERAAETVAKQKAQERQQLQIPAAAGASSEPKKKKKLSFKDQRELDSMEANIHAAEELLARLTAESALPENATNSIKLTELSQKMSAAHAEIDRLYQRWSELESAD